MLRADASPAEIMSLSREGQLIVETGLGDGQVAGGEGGLTDITMRPGQPGQVADLLRRFQALTARPVAAG